MIPTRAVLATVAVAVATLAPAPARAETYHTCSGFIDALPAVISTQGTWCLRADLATTITGGQAISIAANNVTIDCNGFKLGGLGGGQATDAIGVFAENQLNATVRGCTVRGFRHGVLIAGFGGGHLVERNRLDGNRVTGIEVHGDGSMVRDNLVFDTGNSFLQSSIFGIAAADGVDVRDNVVDGVAPFSGHANAVVTGIFLQGNTRGAVVGNRVGGLVSVGTGHARGIYNNSSQAVTIADNILVGDDRPGGIGIRCTSTEGVARDNVVLRFADAVQGCTSVGNTTPP